MSDVDRFGFVDSGPWEVELDQLVWRHGLDHVRIATRVIRSPA